MKTAKALGAPALALTDKNNMFGAFDFSKTAKAEGIKPIIGTQMPLMYNKEKNKIGYLVFIAQNEIGYKNISAIMCDAQDPKHDKGNPYTFRAETLIKHHEGVIILSGGLNGLLPNMIKDGAIDKAKEIISFLSGLMGDRFYIQINRNGVGNKETKQLETQLLNFAVNGVDKVMRSDGSTLSTIPVVATSETLYVENNRHDAYEILHAIDTSTKASVTSEGIERKDESDYHFKTQMQFAELFSDIPIAVENTKHLADRCSFLVEGRNPILPAFETEGGRTEDEEPATSLCWS